MNGHFVAVGAVHTLLSAEGQAAIGDMRMAADAAAVSVQVGAEPGSDDEEAQTQTVATIAKNVGSQLELVRQS